MSALDDEVIRYADCPTCGAYTMAPCAGTCGVHSARVDAYETIIESARERAYEASFDSGAPLYDGRLA